MKTFFLAVAYITAALITGEPVVTGPSTSAVVQPAQSTTTSTGDLRP